MGWERNDFLGLITPLCSYLYGGLCGGLYERAHIIRYFPPLAWISPSPSDHLALPQIARRERADDPDTRDPRWFRVYRELGQRFKRRLFSLRGLTLHLFQ
jgi:hypothetical protein